MYCIPIFNTENNLYCIFKISASGLFIKHPLISTSIKHVPIYKRVFRSVSYATHFESRSRDKAGAGFFVYHRRVKFSISTAQSLADVQDRKLFSTTDMDDSFVADISVV